MDSIPVSRTDRKKVETRNKIITAAVNLFNQFGLEAVTMEQIAEVADIAKGTLYNYFSSKDTIIVAYIQRTFGEHNDERMTGFHQLPDTRARLTFLLRLLIEGVQRQKDLFETFMVYRMKQVISFKPVEDNEVSGLSRLTHEIISMGISSHELRSDLPEDVLSGLVEYALIAAIKPYYLNPEAYDPEKAIGQCVDLFLNGSKLK